VDFEHELELLVRGLVEHGVEGESGVVDNNVDLAKSPVCTVSQRNYWLVSCWTAVTFRGNQQLKYRT